MKKMCLIIVAIVMCLTLIFGHCACGFLGGSSSAFSKDEKYTYRYSSGSYYGNLTVNFTQKQFEYEGYTIYGSSSAFLLDPVMSCSGGFYSDNYSQSGMDRYRAAQLTPTFYIWVAQDKSYVLIGGLRFNRS